MRKATSTSQPVSPEGRTGCTADGFYWQGPATATPIHGWPLDRESDFDAPSTDRSMTTPCCGGNTAFQPSAQTPSDRTQYRRQYSRGPGAIANLSAYFAAGEGVTPTFDEAVAAPVKRLMVVP
jgi:hypothetical protein